MTNSLSSGNVGVRRRGMGSRVAAVASNDFAILKRDPVFLIVFTAMPLAFMAFTKGAFGAALQGTVGARISESHFNGAEQVVPGAAVLFSGFMVGNLGFGMFREHSWSTWDRLRASRLTNAEILIGKSIVPVCTLAFQILVMLVAGALLFDLHVEGSLVGFCVVAAALALMELGLGLALLAVCRSVLQLNAATNLGAMLLGGIGGAVTPVELLPSWARTIAPATPAYWAMRGFRTAVSGVGGSIMQSVAVLLLFAVGFTALAAWRFRVDDEKIGWA